MKSVAKSPFPLKALLLSCLDYTALQIELTHFAQRVAATNAFPLETLFPRTSMLMPTLIWFALFILRLKAPDGQADRKPVMDGVFAFLLACATVVLHSVWVEHDFSYLTANKKSLLLSGFSVLGLTLFMANVFRWLHHLCGKWLAQPCGLPGWWKRHPFLFPFAVIVAAWLPLLVLRYPGTAEYDAYGQLLNFLGHGKITNHWPVSSGALFWLLFTAGKFLFGSANAAYFFLTVCLALFCAACFACSLKTMYRLKIKNQCMVFTLVLYAAFTIFSRYCTSLTKDSLFACMLLVCVCHGAEMLFGVRSVRAGQLVWYAVLCFVMGILRSNGPHTLLLWAAVVVIGWLFRRDKRLIRLFASLTAAFVLCQCYLNVLLPALNIPGGHPGEALSIPLMQTARYVRDHGDEVTEEEKQIIDRVVTYDTLVENYNDRLSDGVKFTYHAQGDALRDYIGVWLRQGLRHPETYALATLNNVCGFFYPGAGETALGIYTTDNPTYSVRLAEIDQAQDSRRIILMDRLQELILAFENFPLFYPFCNVAVQVWLMGYLLLVSLCRRQNRLTLLLVPSFVTLLVCVAGPTFVHNGIRYALPVIFINPFLFALYLQQTAADK